MVSGFICLSKEVNWKEELKEKCKMKVGECAQAGSKCNVKSWALTGDTI